MLKKALEINQVWSIYSGNKEPVYFRHARTSIGESLYCLRHIEKCLCKSNEEATAFLATFF